MSPAHGTRSRYVSRRCRCDLCRAANRDYQRRAAIAAARRSYGIEGPDDMVPSDRAKAHIQGLQAAGMGWRRIAAAAGVSATVVGRLAGYSTSRPAAKVRRTTEARILAVAAATAAGALIPAGASARKTQALAAIGWTITSQADAIGVTLSNFAYHRLDDSHLIEAGTAARIDDMYRRLHMSPAPDGYGATRARRMAAGRGWMPPLGWDDIDAGIPAPPGDADADAGCATCAEAVFLHESGEPAHTIAASLHLTASGVGRHLTRHGHDALAAVFGLERSRGRAAS